MASEPPKTQSPLNARQIADLKAAGMKTPFERRLVISSRIAEGYQLTEDGRKHLQHILTVWFPRALHRDLTDDTVRVDIVVRRGAVGNRSLYTASFLRADGTVIKTTDYDEDRVTGAQCQTFDQLQSGYCGSKDGVDYRLVVYGPEGR